MCKAKFESLAYKNGYLGIMKGDEEMIYEVDEDIEEADEDEVEMTKDFLVVSIMQRQDVYQEED